MADQNFDDVFKIKINWLKHVGMMRKQMVPAPFCLSFGHKYVSWLPYSSERGHSGLSVEKKIWHYGLIDRYL